MSEYTKRLHDFINGYEFVRSFYGVCPDCGKRVFSIGDDVGDDQCSIKAKFVCECGKKWRETVYSQDIGHYKYQQALVQDYYDRKRDKTLKVLKLGNKIYLPTSKKVVSKEV